MARKQTKATESKPQTFAITAPDATSVKLVGDFTQWEKKPIGMAKQDGGAWIAKVKLPPGTHHYRFLVDGHWCDDPNCTQRVPNPYGGENSVRAVS